MAIFPLLEIEPLVQELDKTRLNGLKSFDSSGAAFSAVTIKPDRTTAAQTVTSAKYLDWAYSFKIDVDASNNKLDFSEGGPELTATLSSGQYTLAALATEIKTQMDSVGGTYTVSVSDDTFTISSASNFSLLVTTGTNAATSIFSHIGFSADQTGAASYEGSVVEEVDKLVTLTINGTDSQTFSLSVISASADKLYSADSDLVFHEPDLLKYVPVGRASFKNIHRRAQTLILAYLDKEGFVDVFGDKLTKASLTLTDELKEWSVFMVLRLIFEGLSNAVDDIFKDKAKNYERLEGYHRERAILRGDFDNDGVASSGEAMDIRSGVVVRR